MADTSETNLVELFLDLDSVKTFSRKPNSKKAICIWLPEEYKHEFDMLQVTTGREFGRRLQTLIKRSIEIVRENKKTEIPRSSELADGVELKSSRVKASHLNLRGDGFEDCAGLILSL